MWLALFFGLVSGSSSGMGWERRDRKVGRGGPGKLEAGATPLLIISPTGSFQRVRTATGDLD